MFQPPSRAVPIPNTRVWQDISTYSTVLVCDLCGHQWGPFLDGSLIIGAAARDHHQMHHSDIQGFTREEAAKLTPCQGHSECEKPVVGKGLCMTHYQQQRRAAKAMAIA